MATTLAAKAIDIHDHRIAPGSVADLVVVKGGFGVAGGWGGGGRSHYHKSKQDYFSNP